MNRSPFRTDQRAFLAALAAAPLAATACRPRKYDPARFERSAVSPVFLSAVTDYAADLADVVMRGISELGVDVRGKRVLLKPNLVEYEPGSAINTHPSVIVGAAIAMRRAGAADVVVGEAPGHQRDIEYLVTATSLSDHLREHCIRFVWQGGPNSQLDRLTPRAGALTRPRPERRGERPGASAPP
jgi:hypothetical protein